MIIYSFLESQSDEVLGLYSTNRSPSPELYATNMGIKSIVDTLIDGTFSGDEHNLFYDIYRSLVQGNNGSFADPYCLLLILNRMFTLASRQIVYIKIIRMNGTEKL